MGPIVFDQARFGPGAAELIARKLFELSAGRADVSLALSGGTTIVPVYEHLAALDGVSLNWRAMNFYFGDERAVPADHRDSNYRLAREALLSRVPAIPERVHRMEAERADLDQAAHDYEALLPAALDLVLLGMGEDGHVASLFPGSAALEETERSVIPAFGGTPRVARLTITPKVLARAGEIIVVVNGSRKRDAVSRALEGPLDPSACPAQLVRRATWILDAPAAAGLHPSPDPRT
jgi:6-phosphogluconolactonase